MSEISSSTPAGTSKSSKKGNNMLWWILGIGGGLAAWLLFSSFKSTATQETIQDPDSNLSKCNDDYNCSRGYWAWELLKDDQKRKDIASRSVTTGKSVLQQALDEAQDKMVSDTKINLSQFEAQISTIISKWKSVASQVSVMSDKALQNGVSLAQQYRDDAIWSLLTTLSDLAAKYVGNSRSDPPATTRGLSSLL